MASPPQTVNGVPLEQILEPTEFRPDLVERIAFRKVKGPPIAIVEPDPEWPQYFDTIKSRIFAAFADPPPAHNNNNNNAPVTVLAINHVGSTSVPNLPAKPVIDIDLVLSCHDLDAESYYVPRLESAGFQFLLREPAWHGHRFLAAHEPMSCNLHVWGPQCPEVERHLIFRNYLRRHQDDRELYAKTKTEAAAISREKGEVLMEEYNARKEQVLRGILERAFRELAYL